MILFFRTPSLIGLINGRLFILTNQQVVLMGLSVMADSLDLSTMHTIYKCLLSDIHGIGSMHEDG